MLKMYHRVQGYGYATIHDVSLSTMPSQAQTTTSSTLQELLAKKDRLRNAIHRARTSSRALEAYMGSMSVHDVPLSQVGLFLESYNLHGSKLDGELGRLKHEEDEVYNEIQAQKDKEQLSQSSGGTLGMQVSVGLFAENEGQIELELVYGNFAQLYKRYSSLTYCPCSRVLRELGSRIRYQSQRGIKGPPFNVGV